jgi:DNA-binding transcriptional LysR family regulator
LQPEELVTPYLISGQLVEIMPEYQAPKRPMHLVHAPDRRMTPKLRSFVDFIVANFGMNQA